MAKFERFDPKAQLAGLVEAARQIQREEQSRKTREEVSTMVRPEQLELFGRNIVAGSRTIQ